VAREHRFLDNDLAIGAFEDASAEVRVFALGVSRTTKKSMSPALRPASGQGTPSNNRTGRRLMYWSNSRRNFSSDPHSDTWSGTVAGQPTAPK
jgi:hypothetical protein